MIFGSILTTIKNMRQSSPKILIVEDEPDLLEMYRLYFGQAGYEIIEATDGQIGVDLIKQKNPDLILLDILLPKIDGWQILKELKENPDTKKIPIIVFSNLAQADEIQKGLKLGADDYVIKSNSTPKELLERIQNLLNNKLLNIKPLNNKPFNNKPDNSASSPSGVW